MKLYRIIALICILIANLCILGHAIIPHCHCDRDELCVIMHHNDCDENACDETQHHSRKGESGSCILTQIVPQHHSSVDEILPDVSDSNITLLFYDIPLDLLKIDLPNTSVRHIAFDEVSHYTSYVSPTLGLRAPPFI
ncbi:DUF6769 family protein [Dysgonomonas massiliensis]|uniref:DUF6769 family protein n=1 Tax=Dysgonomonas massiliensis TaxID=2040292 RepID=UPI0011AF7C8C|nr:DUF6769 family protein [Dysgonomonas massiliensis]